MQKFTGFIFAVFLFSGFYVQANTKACRIMFGADLPKMMPATDRVRMELVPVAEQLSAQLQYFYGHLSEAKLKQDFNAAISHISETNNEILDAAVYLQGEKSHFSSRSQREKYNELMVMLKSLMYKQGMPEAFVEEVFDKRFQAVEALKKEEQRPLERPMGFIADQPRKTKENAKQVKIIGFAGKPIEQTLYGRVKESRINETAKTKVRMGFIHSETADQNQPEAKLASIGFVQSADSVDVNYQISLSFNFQLGIFEVNTSERQALGFTNSK